MKHKDLIDQLTLEEKAALLGGKGEWDSRDIPRLGIPSMIMSAGTEIWERKSASHWAKRPKRWASIFCSDRA